MAFNIDYEVAAFCILIFFYINFKLMYKIENTSTKYYQRLLLATLIATFMDLATAVTDSYAQQFPLTLNYVLNSVYFVMTMICVYALTLYINALEPNASKKNHLNRINLVIASVYSLFIMCNPIYKKVIYFDENYTYCHGPWYYIIYILPIYFLLFSAVRLFLIRNRLNMRQFWSALFFVLFILAGAVLQMTVFGQCLIQYFVISLGVMIIVFSFETPDYPKLIQTTRELEESQRLLKEANDREKEVTKTLHQLMKSASWAIYMDSEGGMQDAVWSDEFFKMLGYQPGQYQGDKQTAWADSLHPDDREENIAKFFAGMQGDRYDTEYRLRSADGSYHWYRGSGESKYDENGKMISYQGVIQNIDEEKLKEQLISERLQAMEDLEKSKEELQKALFIAEEASRAKTTFLSNMSHDIRTPMNAIVGFTDLAMGHVNDSEEVEDCLGTIRTSANHLLNLINDVLDMSRIESGKVKVEPSPCDLRVLFAELKSMIQSNLLEKKQNYIEDFSGIQSAMVMCDRLRMNQVLLNCISNSMKFTDEGGTIKISVNQESTAREGYAYYVIRIEDNGIGMSRHFLERVFEPFEREKSSTVSKIQGTGLGMAITKNLVGMMGGTIVVESVEHEGTAYTITLPLKLLTRQEIAEAANVQPAEVKPIEELVKKLKGRRFLVVDDNAVNRKIVNRLLTEHGMIIEEAEDGPSAIARLENMEEGDIDMVFMDIQMPDMNGYEVTDRLRALPNPVLKKLPIIAMTANAFEEDRQEAAKHGMNGHIAKPFKFDTLIATISPLLN